MDADAWGMGYKIIAEKLQLPRTKLLEQLVQDTIQITESDRLPRSSAFYSKKCDRHKCSKSRWDNRIKFAAITV